MHPPVRCPPIAQAACERFLTDMRRLITNLLCIMAGRATQRQRDRISSHADVDIERIDKHPGITGLDFDVMHADEVG